MSTMKYSFNLSIFSLIICGCYFIWGGFSSGQNWGDDFAAYIMQGQGIANGNIKDFLISNKYTVENSSYQMGPTAYPWGFPIFIAITYFYVGFNLYAFKMIGLCAYAGFLFSLFFGFKSKLSKFWLFFIISFFAFNPFIYGTADQILSDLPVLFFSTISIFYIQHIYFDHKKVINIYTLIFLGVLINLSFLIRTNGLILIPILFIAQFFSSKNLNLTTNKLIFISKNLIPYFVFIILYFFIQFLLPNGGSSHLGHLNDINFETIKTNLFFYLNAPHDFFRNIYIYLVFSIVFFVGLFNQKKDDYILSAYISLTFLAYLIWPNSQDIRFLLPILPFYIYFSLKGLAFIQYKISFFYLKRIFLLLSCSICLILITSNFLMMFKYSLSNRESGRPIPEGPFTPLSEELFSYIKNNTEATDVIIFWKPRVMHLLTQRNAIMILDINKIPNESILVLDLKNLSSQISLSELKKLIVKNKATLIFENSQFQAFEISAP